MRSESHYPCPRTPFVQALKVFSHLALSTVCPESAFDRIGYSKLCIDPLPLLCTTMTQLTFLDLPTEILLEIFHLAQLHLSVLFQLASFHPSNCITSASLLTSNKLAYPTQRRGSKFHCPSSPRTTAFSRCSSLPPISLLQTISDAVSLVGLQRLRWFFSNRSS